MQNEQKINSYLHRVANILLINGGFLDNPGLYTGETGLVLFFFRYARYTHNDLYREYAYGLLDKIQNRLHLDTPVDYKQGLAGIGAAIEYLTQNGYIEANTDEILEEFDDVIFSLEKIPCLPLDELPGIGHYALWRMAGDSIHTDMILKKVLPRLVSCINEKGRNPDVEYRTAAFLKDITETENPGILSDMSTVFRPCRNRYPYGFEINTFNRYLEQFSNNDFVDPGMFDSGLQNGLSGFGMALITGLDGDNSWISLLPNDFNTE